MARRSVEPSTMSLLGVVWHLAEVEPATFRVLMAGQDVPRLFCSAQTVTVTSTAPFPAPGGRRSMEGVASGVDFATRFVTEAPSRRQSAMPF